MGTLRSVKSSELRERRLSYFISGLATIAATGHGFILVFAVVAEIPVLVVFNIGSIVLYIGLLFLNKRGRYSLVLITALLEVLVHAIVATLVVGWAASFHLYVLCLIPLIFYIDQWPIRVRGGASVAVLLTYVTLSMVVDIQNTSGSEISDALVRIARYGNMSVAAGVLIALSFFYQAAVSRAERYMEHYSDTLERLSLSDPLTGVLNRRGTEQQLQYILTTAKRMGTRFAVAIIDLDHFKSINDQYGHNDGDRVLRTVASSASTVVRESDLFGRWGGEEFLAILPDTDEAGARVVAQRIREAINGTKTDLSSGQQLSVTATIGVAVYDPTINAGTNAEAITSLVSRADEALYIGKSAGRDQVVVSDSRGQ